jgi:enoyl-CoA hydratase
MLISSEDLILREVKDGIAVVCINRPAALNALNSNILEELEGCMVELDKDPTVMVIIITGSGEKAFVAGADLSELVNLKPAAARVFAEKGHRTFNIIERCTKPVIAAVNGYALGGGCELAMACDIRIASSKARLGQPEVGLGIIPGFGGTQRLPRLVSKGKAKELLFTGVQVSAQDALAIGLVDKVVEPENLMDEAVTMAKTIASKAPLAVRAAKRLIDHGTDTDFQRALTREVDEFYPLFETQDQKEGMNAFLERRPAKFVGA